MAATATASGRGRERKGRRVRGERRRRGEEERSRGQRPRTRRGRGRRREGGGGEGSAAEATATPSLVFGSEQGSEGVAAAGAESVGGKPLAAKANFSRVPFPPGRPGPCLGGHVPFQEGQSAVDVGSGGGHLGIGTSVLRLLSRLVSSRPFFGFFFRWGFRDFILLRISLGGLFRRLP